VCGGAGEEEEEEEEEEESNKILQWIALGERITVGNVW